MSTRTTHAVPGRQTAMPVGAVTHRNSEFGNSQSRKKLGGLSVINVRKLVRSAAAKTFLAGALLCGLNSVADGQGLIIPGGTYSEQQIAQYSYHHCGNIPTADPCDDIVINTDMMEVSGYGVIKAIAWSSSNTGNTSLYVEDYSGTGITIPIYGYVQPDVVIAASSTAPNYPASSGYQVLLVYTDGSSTYFDSYDLYNVGLPSFYLQSAISSALPNNMSNPPSQLLGNCDGFPHIDMWTDAGTTFNTDPSLHQFVYTWSDGGIIKYCVDDIASLSYTVNSLGARGNMPDVAAFTEVYTGDQRFVVAYSNPATTTPPFPGNIDVWETSLGGASVPNPTIADHTTDAYAPRIEALSQYDSTRAAKWQIATTVAASNFPQVVNGYNDLTSGATDMSSLLSPLYPTPPWLSSYTAMGACVAGGVGYGAPSSNIGNNQYTVGFYPWQHDSLYARDVSVTTGTLLTSSSCYLVNNASVHYPWDRAVNFALTNCSNTGRDILAAWYDGNYVVYKHSSGNSMAFKSGPTSTVTINAHSDNVTVAPNPAKETMELHTTGGGTYAITDVTGKTLISGQAKSANCSIDVHGLASGVYIMHLQEASSVPSTTIKFTKQ